MSSADVPIPGFYAVLPAGGSGTRLWPLSRSGQPKFLLDLVGDGQSLLQGTWARLRGLADAERMYVVTGRQHADAVVEQLPELDPANLLAEPSPRDTAAAMSLAAAVIAARDPEAVLGAFPADHIVEDAAAFRAAVAEAVRAAREGYVTTLGIDPSFPSTAFGYIQMGEPIAIAGAETVRRIEKFVEKPDPATAARYLEEGVWRWNAGMFVSRADVLLDELAKHRPRLHAGVTRIAQSWDTADRDPVLAYEWPRLDKISIDYAVAEPAAAEGRMAVVPARFGWDDIGDFAALLDRLRSDQQSGPIVLGDADRVFSIDTTGLVVAEGGRSVSVCGIKDVVIVDTPDMLLVTTRDRAQDVKQMVEEVKKRGQTHLT